MKTMILEKDKRFSESLIWELQQSAYCQFGPEAWSQKGVPSYVTSNPYTAQQYANIALGYLRDCSSINTSHPVYIFDLGAGSGRFTFLFLKAFLDIPALRHIKFRYVMTDIAEKNISFWKTHPYLQPFIEQGILDFAIYSDDQKSPLKLILSNETISNPHNPIILIANYFFDTIPQDVFRISNGHLEEGRVSLSLPKEIDLRDPNIISHLNVSYTYHPLPNFSHYYSSSTLNQLLKQYVEQFDNTYFYFPIGAFQTIQYFSKISHNKLCLIAGDQGVTTPEQILAWGEPKISKHGTFSTPVSYHVLANYFSMHKGLGLLTTSSDPQFVVMTGILGGTDFPETQYAFQSTDHFEPCDYWKIVNCAEKETSSLSYEHIILLLKLGYWDPMVLNSFYEQIRSNIPNLISHQMEQLKSIVKYVWNHYYPIGKEGGLFIMNLGVLFYELKDYTNAFNCFKQSLELTGPNPQILQNLKACQKIMKR